MTVKLNVRASNIAMINCFLETCKQKKQITIIVKYIANREKASGSSENNKIDKKLTNIDETDNVLRIGFNVISTKEKPNRRLVQITTAFVKS